MLFINKSKSLILNSEINSSTQALLYLFLIKDDNFVASIVSINSNAYAIVSSLKSPSFIKMLNLSCNSEFIETPSFNGNNLTSVRDGEISFIHNLSYSF